MRIVSTLLFILFAFHASAEPVTKSEMTDIVLNANDVLYQTEAFLQFTTTEQIDRFRLHQINPIAQQVKSMEPDEYRGTDLDYCRDYLKTVLNWFDLMIDYKAGKHDASSFNARRKMARQNIDQDARDCAFILSENN